MKLRNWYLKLSEEKKHGKFDGIGISQKFRKMPNEFAAWQDIYLRRTGQLTQYIKEANAIPSII
jgi:hypothetical protein